MKTGPRFPHLVIRASAGTGKTHQLAVRFISLLADGARPEEILATTFTRKAAGEILDRVLFWLARAAADDGERKRLATEIGERSLSRERCRELLSATLRRLHCLRIGTLDSYFIQVASMFGQELGLPPGWSICDEHVDAVLREQAIELVLAHGRLSDLLTLVHSLTKGAAARSVSQLVQGTVGSLLELYRETSPAAWEQIAVSAGLPEVELAQTLDAIASFSLPAGQLCQARDKDVEKARRADWENFIKNGFASKILAGDCSYNRKPLPPELVSLYQLLLRQAEAYLVGQLAHQTRATQQLLERFVEHYRALQLEERVLRFGDVTFQLAAAANVATPERLAFRLDGGIRHILLDEFQDTAPSQWRVIRPLATSIVSPSKSGEGSRAARPDAGSFFCVGDVKQAIYGWRGGVAEIFDALGQELTGLTESKLATSRRSAQVVIDAINAVFQNLTRHPDLDKLAEPVAHWQQAFPKHSTARGELAGHVTLVTAPAAEDKDSQADLVFRYAAKRIEALVEAAPQATFGVLVRTNAAVARLIYLLKELGVAASEEGGNPLIDSPAVELILSLLKLADHPGDLVARFHLANSPLSGPLQLADYEDDAASDRISRQMRRQLLDCGYGATIFAWAQRLAPSCDPRDLSRLQQLVELAYEYQQASTLRADDFIRLVEQKRIADPSSSAVRVMTIHQAKGLQFDVVFLPELSVKLVGQSEIVVAGRPTPTEPVHAVCRLANEHVRQFLSPPLQKLFEDDMRREVTEALCLLYVGMTRAVHALHMIIPPAKSNERKLPKTYAGLLRAALAPDKPATGGQTLYEHGDAKWFRSKVAGTLRVPLPTDGTRSAPTTILLAPTSAQRQRGLERTSPSKLEGGARLKASCALAPRAGEATRVGTLLHAWLQRVEWLEDGTPDDAALRQIAQSVRSEIGDVSGQLDRLISLFRKQLAAKSVAAVLSRDFYAAPANLGLDLLASRWSASRVELQVHREHPFAIRHGDNLLAGNIDRLVVIRNGGRAIAADILDFKTDDISPHDATAIADKVAFYRPQAEAYRLAAARWLNLDRRRLAARLVFLSAGAVQAV
jgi:ATP-dependent exoDNAse (exonuclease V) beta subunit